MNPNRSKSPRTKHAAKLTAAGTAAAGIFALQHGADAAVVYSGVQNFTTGFAGQFGVAAGAWNLDGLGGNDFGFLISNGTVSGQVLLQGISGAVMGGGGSIFNLALNAPISGAGPWAGSGRIVQHVYGVGQGYFANNVPGFVGIKFQDGADLHYGWIRVRWNDNGDAGPEANFVTAIDWAYDNTPDAPILAGDTGAVPEPSRALLALAGAGAAVLRRRRKSAAV